MQALGSSQAESGRVSPRCICVPACPLRRDFASAGRSPKAVPEKRAAAAEMRGTAAARETAVHRKASVQAAQPAVLPSFIPGSACSGCRSGAEARSSQDCRGQRQTAVTPALRLRLSLHKVRLCRPLRHLFATPYHGTSPAIRRSRSESRVGFCAMASRSARVWGGTPVWIAARTCKPCALRTGKAQTCALPRLALAFRPPSGGRGAKAGLAFV